VARVDTGAGLEDMVALTVGLAQPQHRVADRHPWQLGWLDITFAQESDPRAVLGEVRLGAAG
jgi:hypothetical protein